MVLRFSFRSLRLVFSRVPLAARNWNAFSLERFLKREKTLKRNDLILPVYYVNCPILHDDEKRKSDPLAMIIAERQYADLRELRFEPITSPEVGKMLAKMGAQIIGALERERPERKRPKLQRKRAKGSGTSRTASKRRARAEDSGLVESSAESAEAARGPVAKTEPHTVIVDALHRADHPTLTAALAAAKPGDRILVRPGLYRESVVIDKPVEIIGDGQLGEVVIEATGKSTVFFKATMGRVANLTVRQAGGEWYGVEIAQGRLDLEGCDITSQGLSCVAIHGGADPRLRRNRIHDGKQGGVYVYESGLGTLEDNDIFANTLSGLAIKSGGNPTLRRNRIHDGKETGVYVFENGLGTLEDNDIFANDYSGLTITSGGNPTVRRNRIHNGKESGVLVYDNGQGTLEDNEIFGNTLRGVTVQEGGRPTFRRNRISQNGHHAIRITQDGGGVFENNDLRGNTKGAWDISEDSEKNVKRTGNLE